MRKSSGFIWIGRIIIPSAFIFFPKNYTDNNYLWPILNYVTTQNIGYLLAILNYVMNQNEPKQAKTSQNKPKRAKRP